MMVFKIRVALTSNAGLEAASSRTYLLAIPSGGR
jgi:hypothetical protein